MSSHPARPTRIGVEPPPSTFLGDAVGERDIVERVRDGDVDAFDALVRTYAASMCALAFRYVQSRETAEEVVQEVFLNIWVNRRQWTARGGVASYVHAAARNRALNHVRARRAEARWAGDTRPDAAAGLRDVIDPRDAADRHLESVEFAEAARRAVAALPERCRIAYLLVRERQLSYAEAARAMGTSVPTVNVQIGRALRALRQRLAAFLPDGRTIPDP